MQKRGLSKVISACLAVMMLLGIIPVLPDTFSIDVQAENSVSATVTDPFNSYKISFEGETYVEFLPELDGVYEFRISSSEDISIILFDDKFETISDFEGETSVLEYFYEAGKTYYFRVTDILENNGTVTVDMMITITDAAGNVVKTEAVSGSLDEYALEGVADGEYTITIEKATYATRKYTVLATEGKVSLGFELCRNGDVTGDNKVNTIDVARANSHAKGVSMLSYYNFTCADVTGDGKVNTIDVARINSHAKGVSLLW